MALQELLNAAQALWQIDRQARAPAGTMVALLKDSDPDVRVSAAAVLAKMGPAAQSAVRIRIRSTSGKTWSPHIFGRAASPGWMRSH